MKRFSHIGLALLLLWAGSVVWAAPNDSWKDLPSFKLMRGMQATWVAKNIKYNGIPMSIRTFHINQNKERVKNYYSGYWKAKVGANLAVSQNGEFDVLGVEKGDYYYSMQIKQAGRKSSIGTLTVSISPHKVDKNSITKTAFPIPSQSQLESRIESNDNGVLAENILFSTKVGMKFVTQWYRTRLIENGWAFIDQVQSDDGVNSQLMFQKDNQNVMVSVSNTRKGFGKASVEINWIKGKS